MMGKTIMGGWQDILTAPMDGRAVHVRRIHNGSIVKEGLAVFDVPAATAPMLQPSDPHPLGDHIDREVEAKQIERSRVTKRWMNPDRIYAFPQPTEWRSESA